MPVRDLAERVSAIEALLIQSFAERFSKQLNPLHSLQTFSDHVFDVAGRSDSLQSLLEQIDRCRKFIEQHRHIR